jgi:hypothetical protein
MVTRLLIRSLRNGAWVRRGRPDLVPYVNPGPDPDPDPAVWPEVGTYRPGPGTTGPRPGVTLVRFDGKYTVSTPNALVENLDIYGQLHFTSNATNPVVRNCIVRGPGSAAYGSNMAAISSSSASLRGAVIEDTRIDLTGRENAWVDGIRGSDFTMRRSEITRTVDGLSLVGPAGNVTLEASWIHDGFYTEWTAGDAHFPNQSDHRTHGDAVQFHRGKNITLRGNSFGGKRGVGGIGTDDPLVIAAKDAGDDYENSCIMFKQEVSSLLVDRIENALVELNWFEGGAASLNIAVARSNFYAGSTFQDNRFCRKQPDVWGGYYIMRTSTTQAVIRRNVFDDTGLPVTITNG